MQVLRVPPYPITIKYTVPIAGAMYRMFIQNTTDFSSTATDLVSASDSTVSYTLLSVYTDFDAEYLLQIFDEEDNLVVEDNLTISRPYVVPSTKATTASDILEYTKNEQIARLIIDSVTDGFYNKKIVIDREGLGNDYMPVWERANSVLKVYENNVLIYDKSDPTSYEKSFGVTADGTALVIESAEEYNRDLGAPVLVPGAESDSVPINVGIGSFARGLDYVIVLDSGYKVVPLDIQTAAEMLIDDIACGKLDYYKRYITSYNTDQFRIQFDKKILDGTGNILVDNILSKYTRNVKKLGVL
jgi:hypothetical protein